MEIIILILSYILGSIPFALVIGKLFYKTDIREHGSKNLGGTNATRVLGKKPGIFVMLGDALKGTLAASLPYLFEVDIHIIFPAILAIIGHCYPIFAGFRGGKAVATTAGVMIVIAPLGLLIALSAFLIFLKLFKYVSLSSVIAAFVIFMYSLFIDSYTAMFSFLIFALILYKHKENIKRIINKSESKVSWI